MSGSEVHFQNQAAAQVNGHQVGGGGHPVFGHRLNAAILESQIAQGLEACLPEFGGVDEMPQGLAVGENPGSGHVSERGPRAAGVVNVDMRQDDEVDLIGMYVQFGQRGQQMGYG
jgi:hypothetical protein